ncbi:hypothetical protein [Bradyrhizobium sp. Bra78]|nr:hypothetical protein [Bradyrhizobium sp. Bra78]
MSAQQLNDFTVRWLMALKTSQADGDHKRVRIIIDALAKAHGIPVNYGPR